jgi:hypothetical protein
MLLYLRPSSPYRPSSEELSDAEINTRIHKVLAHGVDLNPGTGPAPLREGVDSTKVSSLGFIFGSLHNFILSSCLYPYAGSWVCSQHAAWRQLI